MLLEQKKPEWHSFPCVLQAMVAFCIYFVSQKYFPKLQMWKRLVIQIYLFPFCSAENYIDLMISSYTFYAISCVVKTNIVMC